MQPNLFNPSSTGFQAKVDVFVQPLKPNAVTSMQPNLFNPSSTGFQAN